MVFLDTGPANPAPWGRIARRGEFNGLLVAVVAIDLGGTAMKGALAPAAGELAHRQTRPTGRDDGPEAVLERRFGTGESARAIVALALAGEPRAAAVWREAIAGLAAGLAAAVVLLDPERIVIGGGLADAGEALFGPLRPALAHRLTFTAAPPVVPAALGAEAGSHGAALAAREALG